MVADGEVFWRGALLVKQKHRREFFDLECLRNDAHENSFDLKH